jgi:uncharacterized coiled-coil protein SlyX
MGEEYVTVGEVSAGEDAGAAVELPTVDVLTGRAFVTGKSGSGKSNSASVVAEKLLDRNLGLMVIDTDGEYYGLKEEYEVLHVGADEECDLQVGVEHADKLATLALERGVPIILDISSFLDEEEARDLVKAVARRLFAKEKKLKQPFLMLVEEVHEYIPEGAGIDECGRMLVKIAKRGRKHGLGIVGISQRPADVKKDFITQCDWLVWHRLTWANDTKVAGRVMGSDYRDRVEGLDDGECFLMADWDDEIRRVQMERKRTFDAGATPGLEDVERPDLKSVSADLVDELAEISERREAVESRVAELERKLAEKDERIEQLEADLADARDLSEMAEQFARAMTTRTDGATDAGEGRDGAPTGDDAATDDRPDAAAAPGAGSAASSSASTDGGETSDLATAAGADAPGAVTSGGGSARPGAATASAAAPPDPELPPALSAEQREIVTDLRDTLSALGEIPRRMLAHYRAHGVAAPVDAHAAAGGTGDRTDAYRHNGTLRETDLIAHAGRGRYRARLRERVREAHGDVDPDPELLAAMTAAVAESLPAARERGTPRE